MNAFSASPEHDRALKRVQVAVHRRTVNRLRRLADIKFLSMAQFSADMLKSGLDQQVRRYKLGRSTAFERVPRDQLAYIKIPLEDGQVRRLQNLSRMEFDVVATIGGAMVEMGVEKQMRELNLPFAWLSK